LLEIYCPETNKYSGTLSGHGEASDAKDLGEIPTDLNAVTTMRPPNTCGIGKLAILVKIWPYLRNGARCGLYYRHSAVSCAKMAEPIDLSFGLWTGWDEGSTS